MAVNKILIMPMYGIGDVLMTTPAVRNLKEQLDVEITYLHMFRTTKDVLKNNPYIKENVYFPFLEKGKLDGLRFLASLRSKFDCSIVFYPSNRRDYSLASYVVGSRLRIGHRYALDDLKGLHFLNNKTVKEDDDLHVVEENLKLLDLLGATKKERYSLEIYLKDVELDSARDWIRVSGLANRMLIGIHPGTSKFKNHDHRRWPTPHFSALIDSLSLAYPGSAYLLFGGSEERILRNEIISSVNHKNNVIPIENVSIREAAAILKNCSLFISNDSGPMHMAAACGVPTVAVFGPTNPVWVHPWGVKHRIVSLGLTCSPCFRYSPRPLRCHANIDYACLRKLEVRPVLDACLDLLRDCGK